MGIYPVRGKWYIDLYVDGRRKRKAIGSRRDAENALTTIKADVLRGEFKFKRESKVHFEAFAQDYLDHVKTNKKKSWQRDDNSLKFLKSYFGGMLLSKISPWDIEEYKRKRLEGEITIKLEPGARKRKEWKVKPATINRELACLKHMFTLAKRWKMADENPVKEVQFFQEQQIEMRILAQEEINRLLSCASPRLRPILIVALNTGMRKGEILHLRRSDVDFDNQFLLLRETKSNRPRKVPMRGLVAETLRALKKERDYVLFANPHTGKPLSDLQTPFKGACRRVGIQDLRFHDLRHTAATHMVMGGVDLVTVKEILGHATIKMTMRYAHPTPENKRHAVEVLAALFAQVPANIEERPANRLAS
jgi:integrase